jgi:hypothetical protein
MFDFSLISGGFVVLKLTIINGFKNGFKKKVLMWKKT